MPLLDHRPPLTLGTKLLRGFAARVQVVVAMAAMIMLTACGSESDHEQVRSASDGYVKAWAEEDFDKLCGASTRDAKQQIIRAGAFLGGSKCPEILKNVWDALHEATRKEIQDADFEVTTVKVTGATAVALLRPELTSAKRLGGHVLDLNEVYLRKEGDRWLIDSATPPSDFEPKRGR